MVQMFSSGRRFAGITTVACMVLVTAACGTNNDREKNTTEISSGDPTAAATQTPTQSSTPLPLNADGLLKATVTTKFGEGDPGKVSVLKIGKLDLESGALPFAFRNNTREAISHVDWTAKGRSAGALVSTGSSQGTIPAQIKPGGIGFAYIYFDNAGDMPKTRIDYEFSAETSEADTSSFNTGALTVTEANATGKSIVGTATNENDAPMSGPYGVQVYCFAGDSIVDQIGSYTNEDDDIEAGDEVSFSVDLYGGKCDKYVLGVSGYFN